MLEVVVNDAVDLSEYEIVETGRWPRGTGELTSGWEQLLGPARCRIHKLAPMRLHDFTSRVIRSR